MRAVSVVLLFTLTLSGCFSYASVPPAATPSQSTPVRVSLTRAMDFPIRDVTVRDVVQVTGEVISDDAGALKVSAFTLRSQTGFNAAANGETVSIPRNAVGGMEQKKLSPLRSGLIGAAIVALALIAQGTGLVDIGGGGGPDPEPQ